jgi:hypothetical protein
MKLISLLLVSFLTASCATAPSALQRVTPLPHVMTTPTFGDVTQVAAVSTPTRAPGPFSATRVPGDLQGSLDQVFAPTATPLSGDLVSGSARAIALATDTAMVAIPDAPLTFEESPVPITFDEFYEGYDLQSGLILSQKLLSLDGSRVVIEGYMAPPLKPELDYFVLTRVRLAFCPFCSNATDWPDDVVLMYMADGKMTVARIAPVRIVGRLEVGASTDMETGMVSIVRVYVETLQVLG